MDKLKQKMQSLREEADANAAKLEDAQAELKGAREYSSKVECLVGPANRDGRR
jgi:hypothetical protein